MEDMNGNKIEGNLDFGTRKYHVMINNRYIVDFKYDENDTKGKGAYHNGLLGLQAMYNAQTIIVSDNKEDALLFDGRINMISTIEKILKNYGYRFYDLRIIELGE